MSISWDADNVSINELDTGSKPSRSSQAYFTDPSSKSLYTWGGLRYQSESDRQDVWRLAVDGRGGGQWDREISENNEYFSDLIPASSVASTTTPHAAYLFGGGRWNTTGIEMVQGFYKYDFERREWSEETDVGYPNGRLYSGSATYVSGFGDRGIIVILGGKTGFRTEDEAYLSFDTVHFYDVANGTWYEQETSGDEKPGRREHACAVGVRGEDSYEM